MRIIDIIKLIISLLLWGLLGLSSVEVYNFFRNAAHERIHFGFGSAQEFNRALFNGGYDKEKRKQPSK